MDAIFWQAKCRKLFLPQSHGLELALSWWGSAEERCCFSLSQQTAGMEPSVSFHNMAAVSNCSQSYCQLRSRCERINAGPYTCCLLVELFCRTVFPWFSLAKSASLPAQGAHLKFGWLFSWEKGVWGTVSKVIHLTWKPVWVVWSLVGYLANSHSKPDYDI